MVKSFIAREGAQPGEVLAFVAEALAEGAEAAVPASCLPVLTRAAKLCPGEGGLFVFRAPSPRAARCGRGERAAAMLLLLAFAPLLALVSLLVLAFDGRPVLFRQERFGCGGAPFTLLKFRTMKRRSDRLHARLQRRLGRDGRLFKLERDPRVTRLGALLRRTFVDELPQLVNVARGEMRFVGPRPLPASDQGHYTRPCHALRLRGMPGMTGLWQVSGRNRLTFDEMCLLDTYYLCNRSLRLDLWLALRTAGVVLGEAGLKREPEGRGEERGGVERTGRGGE
jgi:lipopolysaccharide/colanic/teichoic acid biosynthesis glycosyltransferase